MLNSKQIEIFHTVYQEKSITGAARLLNVSHPSISKTLSLSEDKRERFTDRGLRNI